MRLLAGGPISVAARSWQGARERMTTIVVRVTYELAPVRSEIAAQPERARTADMWFEGARGLDYLRDPSDLAPAKETSDVMVVGNAYAPGDKPVGEVAARLVVGEIDKTVRVTGPRRYGSDRRALAPEPFREAPLDWTHAGGGPDTWNPVGVGDNEPIDLKGESIAPTLIPFGTELPLRGDFLPPAGFGPIAPEWAPRRDVATAACRDWIDPKVNARLSWDESQRPRFFQAAPSDQRLARPIRSDERIVLENLHPKHARLVTSLAGTVLHAAAVDASREQRPIELRADTMWIDTQQSIVTVTHRTTVPARAIDAADVYLWLDGFDGQVKEVGADSQPPREGRLATVAISAVSDDDPFRSTQAVVVPEHTPTMPFASAGLRRPARTAPAPARIAAPAAPSVVVPPAARAPEPQSSPSPSAAFASAPALVAPARPEAALGAAPPLAMESRTAALAAVPMIRPSGPLPSAVPPTWQAAAPPSPPPVQPPRIDTWKLHEEASRKTLDSTPDATPIPEARPSVPEAPPAPPMPVAAIEVAWLDGASDIELASRSKLLAEQLDEEEVEWMSPNEAASGSADRGRADVARYFRKAKPRSLDDLPKLLIKALEGDENERPHVVVSGELTWTFDPRAAIKAWIAVATPLGADPRIKEAIDGAQRAMDETLVTLPEVLQTPLDRLREAVRAITKTVGGAPIEAAVERHLLEERGFGKRKVWAAARLRAHLSAKGSKTLVPVYLSETAGPEAPLIQRFPIRLLAELRTRQDPAEPCAVCLRAVAYGIEIEGLKTG